MSVLEYFVGVTVKLLRFLLSQYSLINTYYNVQNCTFI
jgi:hypothetical protein